MLKNNELITEKKSIEESQKVNIRINFDTIMKQKEVKTLKNNLVLARFIDQENTKKKIRQAERIKQLKVEIYRNDRLEEE